jgi:replication factor A1
MGLEEIINQILTSRSDIKREEILQIIENKKRGARNFLTDQAAARIAASELGVQVVKKPLLLRIKIQDLVSGLNDVTLKGRVVSVFPSKTFKRKDWTEGRLASIIISDKSGTLRVVLWDKKVDLVENGKIQQEQIIRISHGYVRQGRDGKPELHVGDKGKIKILNEEPRKLIDITKTCGPITVNGTVVTIPEIRDAFISKNKKVPVASFQLRDSTGKLKVSVWRNLVEVVKNLKVGTEIIMRNVYAKKRYEKVIELSSHDTTLIEILVEPEN